MAALLLAHHATPWLRRLLKLKCRHGASLGYTNGAKQGPKTWHALQRGTKQRRKAMYPIRHCTHQHVAYYCLRRMLSWVPTPIALRRLHVLWFRFRCTHVWVRAPCWPLKIFARGTAPWSTCGKMSHPQVRGQHQSVGVRIPNSRGHTEAWESVSPTRGAMPKRGSPYPRLEGPRQSVGKKNKKRKERTQYRRSRLGPNASSSLHNKRHLYRNPSC